MKGKYVKIALLAVGIFVVWSLFFGIRLVGYVDSIQRFGLERTACGTDGCRAPVMILDVAWVVVVFVGPLIGALIWLVIWGIRSKR
ncbi:hypothetical protein PWEIH_06526 [Listeria weihenstephanensis FSL R9-0317]|uniref:Uncharacterized protein n=1 Tax=Listeria weihenstephanensis TaxID=1006155 RepID=A0A1S7FR66_9LIST|nr:hypothetical protein [Listeria weihenstephanensis]AQY49941.1 hypothetical protein UE46_01995 [Listeria weihenstephanensis]EUJ39721.1 hypothetical protein PWEIH_06526 [Listeria weihenstephanensis FSL R9-0317]